MTFAIDCIVLVERPQRLDGVNDDICFVQMHHPFRMDSKWDVVCRWTVNRITLRAYCTLVTSCSELSTGNILMLFLPVVLLPEYSLNFPRFSWISSIFLEYPWISLNFLHNYNSNHKSPLSPKRIYVSRTKSTFTIFFQKNYTEEKPN